ncbi:MAG: DNA mismatch repair protein MutS [Prevotella sp.]|nr:DNA mismatch repair protein MutS [Bacteroides sp.]MCM1366991.1 DNA mismatch repair protein MutS [Prevotella sp.]MCM1437500.1 DNA mismatch repair protein MutS [Prevotella sp.]
MKQYYEMKGKHPDAILLFRVGDFYETFAEDAIDASSILGITLTRRANGSASYVELAGFPHHALDTYLPKLVRAGRRVAICEQLEDPKLTKKLVKRGITELVTPGLNTSDTLLSSRENNFLAAVHFGKRRVGVAFLDISTGEFLCAEGDGAYVDKLLCNISPKEVLRMNGTREIYSDTISHLSSIFELDDWVYSIESARERLLRQFDTKSLKGFGVEDMPDAQIAAGSILHYLDITRHEQTAHITALSRIEEDKYVRLDKFTIRNLELLQPMSGEGKSLVDVIDKTCTPMGARMLRRWLLFPLLDVAEINSRLDAVEYFFRDTESREQTFAALSSMGDMERLISKVSTRRAGPRDLLALRDSVNAVVRLKSVMENSDSDVLRSLGSRIPDRREVADTIEATIRPDAPSLLNRGDVIAVGVHEELDALRSIAHNGKAALDAILRREIDMTGITSLKIAFNNVFGYYIEVRNTHRDKVPSTWIRKQTLVNAERYITPELKEYEEKIMGAEDKIAALETEIYNSLLDSLSRHIEALATGAAIAARIDVLHSFALSAREGKYIRPDVNDSLQIDIKEGRHPVIEMQLPPGEPYISNSLRLDSDSQQIIMITGPNMSGKSALLRQTALIVLLAQTGSFVPAQSASIGIVDKIFTRVGASDNLSMGESTFMVEMHEAASILNNISERSLILFDELGRGTSTYDGISIAWSIVEHIHENGFARPRTLFATHYHELNEMEKTFPRIANFNVAVEEIDGKVVFVRKLKRGGSAHSFGIHVAKLAGMPPSIVKRANEVLSQLESASRSVDDNVEKGVAKGNPMVAKADVGVIGQQREGYQLSFFQLDDPLLGQIRDRLLGINIDNLTPLQALTTLHDLQALLTGK